MRSFAGACEPAREQLLAAPLRWPRPSLLDRPPTALSGDWGHNFGTLPAGTDFASIIERHRLQ